MGPIDLPKPYLSKTEDESCAIGGFSAWLCLTVCNNNLYELEVWMTVMSSLALVAQIGLPKGFRSNFGLDNDLAWGHVYFSMTQVVVANLVGVAMAMAMAMIHPGVYGVWWVAAVGHGRSEESVSRLYQTYASRF